MQVIEKSLLYIICFAAFGNLYYITPLLGIPSNAFLILCILISFVFSIGNINRYKNTLYFRFFRLFLFLSVILIPFNIFQGYEFRVNDMIRVFWYVLIFNWIWDFFKDKKKVAIFLRKMSYALFVLFIAMSLFEYYNKGLFVAIVYGELLEEIELNRIAITFRDSNTYAAVISLFLYIILKIESKTLFQILMLLITVVLINFTGSRMGGVLIIFIAFWWILQKKRLKSYVMLAFVLLFCYSLFPDAIVDSQNEDDASVISRVLGSNSKHQVAQASNQERQESLKDGLNFGLSENLIIPAGNFYFDYKWRNTSNHGYHFPHSSFVYLFCEYGIYCLSFYILLFKLFRLSRKNKYLLTFVIVIIPMAFLPNIVYLFPIYLAAFLTEFKLLEGDKSRN